MDVNEENTDSKTENTINNKIKSLNEDNENKNSEINELNNTDKTEEKESQINIESNLEKEEKKDLKNNEQEEDKKTEEIKEKINEGEKDEENKEEQDKKNQKFIEENKDENNEEKNEIKNKEEEEEKEKEKEEEESNVKKEEDNINNDNEENEAEEDNSLKNEKSETQHERSVLSLEGAKPPLSMYTRRVMDISKIDEYLNPNSSRGQIGGRNLGNTCFMNSSIACLSNCTELTYYFLKGDYLKDINEENNLGMRGELAKEWGNLMKQYWVENTRVGDPSDFKYTIGRKAERFRGYGQQDSNEFMSVFLDYLNEDLNKATKKEYVELNEKMEDETDEDCSKRFWEVNLKRNDSIVTDLFCGQFKSTITCPKCQWINITFDPFDTINLPLLTQIRRNEYKYGYNENLEQFKFFYIPSDVLRHPYCLIIKNINNGEEIGKVIDRIAKEKNFIYYNKIEDLFLVDMLRKEKYGYAEKSHIVKQFIYDDEFLFSYDYNQKKDEIALVVYFFKNDTEKSNKSQYPRMVFCKKSDTLEDVRKKIYFYLRKYILSPFLKENEEKDEVTLEIEKYMEDNNNELPYEKLYEKVENEYNKVFKKYDSNEEDKEDKEDVDNNNNKERENKSDDEEEKEKEDKNKNEEENEKEEEENKNSENEIKDQQQSKLKNEEETNNNKEIQNEILNEKKEKETEINKEEKKLSEDDELKKYIDKFKSDIPFEIFIRRERDENNFYGKIPFIDSKHFSNYSRKLKKFLEIENFNAPLGDIQTDLSDYEIIVQFNEESKYINKDTFDLDYFKQIELEYTIKEKEEKKEEEENKKEDEEEIDDGKMTLIKCLKKFCKEEQLQEGDEWYCPKCKEHVLAKKKMDLFYLPKILIICFKRFVKDSYRWEKNEDEVEFPINNLDLKDFVIGPDKNHSKYDLFAVSQHYGSTGFGHYTAVCRNYDGKWYSYDDSNCSETSETETQSSAAYVLFYRRQTD